jgi:hypothetical protein
MEKFGFDYLLKRQELLTEMAAPYKGFITPEYKQFVDTITKPLLEIIKKNAPLSNPSLKAVNFLTRELAMVNGEFPLGNGSYPSFCNEFVKQYQEDYLAWIGDGSNDSNKKYRFTLMHLVDLDPKRALSPEFKEQVLGNVPRIIDYAENNRYNPDSNRSVGYKKEQEATYQMPLAAVQKMRARIAPILSKLKRAEFRQMKAEERASNMGTPTSKAKPTKSRELSTYEVPDALMRALKNILEIKSMLMKNSEKKQSDFSKDEVLLHKLPESDIHGFITKIRTLINTGSDLSEEKVRSKIIDPLINNKDERVSGFGIKLEEEFNDEMEFIQSDSYTGDEQEWEPEEVDEDDNDDGMFDRADADEDTDSEENSPYGDFDEELVTKTLTPEELKFFKKYNSSFYKKQNDLITQMKELGHSDDGSDVAKAEERFFNDPKRQPAKATIDDQIAALYAQGYETDNIAKIKQIKRKIAELQAQKASEEDGGEEEAEETVMGYMTEQISKDAHFNPRGEFVERGFKKPVNYNHWIHLNS